MYFEKDNKKNSKIKFSITLAILLAFSVVISTSVVTKEAYATNPIATCFVKDAVVNPAYIQAVQNFYAGIPNNQDIQNVGKTTGFGSVNNADDLVNLTTSSGLITTTKEKEGILNGVLSLLSGMPQPQHDDVYDCISTALFL